MTDQEINEAVAKKLGNWCGCGHLVKEHSDGRPWGNGPAVCSHGTCKCEEIHYPDYCHSIQAAWEIVDKMDDWSLEKKRGYYKAWFRYRNETSFSQLNKSISMAICLAFLKLEEN